MKGQVSPLNGAKPTDWLKADEPVQFYSWYGIPDGATEVG